MLAKDPLFSLLSDAPQELALIEIGKGEPGIRGEAGGTKKRMAYLQQTRTPLERENGVPLAGVQSIKHTPAAANTANRLQGRGVPIAPQKNGNRAPQTCHPSHRAPTQPLSPAANRRMRNKKLRKNREMQQKRRILRHSCALCAQRIIKRAVKVYKNDRCQKENSE